MARKRIDHFEQVRMNEETRRNAAINRANYICAKMPSNFSAKIIIEGLKSPPHFCQILTSAQAFYNLYGALEDPEVVVVREQFHVKLCRYAHNMLVLCWQHKEKFTDEKLHTLHMFVKLLDDLQVPYMLDKDLTQKLVIFKLSA